MKKINILIIAILALAGSMTAQTQIGLKLGYSTGVDQASTLKLDNGEIYLYDFSSTGQSNVFSAGITARKKLGNFFFSQELMFRQTNKNFEIVDLSVIDPSIVVPAKHTDYNILLPLAMGFNIGKMSLAAGPIFNYKVKTERSADLDKLFRIDDNKLTKSFQFILGFNVNKHITIDVKYEHALNGVSDGYYFNNEKLNFKTSPDLVTFGLSYFL